MKLSEIEEYAKLNNVPIMEPEGIEFLTNFVYDNPNVHKILEVGTAIGYSAIKMCMMKDTITVVTIERDKKRYEEAVKNVKAFNLEDRITLIYGDALEVEVTGEYDMIFIDAAKSQSIKFFEKYKVNLAKNGFILTDNINFHGLTFSTKPAPSRNLRQMIRKIKDYLVFLETNKEFQTKYINIGDGVTVSKRNDE